MKGSVLESFRVRGLFLYPISWSYPSPHPNKPDDAVLSFWPIPNSTKKPYLYRCPIPLLLSSPLSVLQSYPFQASVFGLCPILSFILSYVSYPLSYPYPFPNEPDIMISYPLILIPIPILTNPMMMSYPFVLSLSLSLQKPYLYRYIATLSSLPAPRLLGSQDRIESLFVHSE